MTLFEKKLYYQLDGVTHAIDLYSDISGAVGAFIEIQYSGAPVYVSGKDAGVMLTHFLSPR